MVINHRIHNVTYLYISVSFSAYRGYGKDLDRCFSKFKVVKIAVINLVLILKIVKIAKIKSALSRGTFPVNGTIMPVLPGFFGVSMICLLCLRPCMDDYQNIQTVTFRVLTGYLDSATPTPPMTLKPDKTTMNYQYYHN